MFASFSIFLFVNATKCRCGKKSDGTTSYQVQGDNSDCCEGIATEVGWEHTWFQQNNGVWQVDSSVQTTGSAAQSDCCDKDT